MESACHTPPKGYRWVRRGEWVTADCSQGIFDEDGVVGWKRVWTCFPFDHFTWKPHGCRTARCYIRQFRGKTPMKKTLPTSGKSRSYTGWHKHLRKSGKRVANRGTRQALKGRGREADSGLDN